MKKQDLLRLFPLFLILCMGCSGSVQQEKKDLTGLPVFDLEAAIGMTVPDTFVWNDIVKEVHFIPLASNDSTLLSGSIDIRLIDDEYIVIVDKQTAAFYRYRINGEVERGFQFKGNGPGEYANLFFLYADPKHTYMDVYDDGSEKRIRYDWEGRLIGENSLKGMTAPCYMSGKYGILRGTPETEWQYCIIDSDLNVSSVEKKLGDGYDAIKRSAVQILTSTTQNRDLFLSNFPMSDTVCRITDQGLEPLFILKKGKYDIKYEELGRFMTQAMKTMECLMWMQISSIPGYYLIDYKQGEHWNSEIWNKETRSIVARTKEAKGLPFRLASGREIILPTKNFHIHGNTIVVSLQASELEGEIDGITSDDNPVLLVMKM